MNAEEKKMIQLFNQCSSADRVTIIQFAEFLVSKYPKEESVSEEPLDIIRPESESIMQALKRLGTTYPMLDKSKILAETSDIVTQHVVFKRDIEEAINDLEQVFRKYYQEYKQQD